MLDYSNVQQLPLALEGSLRDFRMVPGADLLKRVEGFYSWQSTRRELGCWPYSRATDVGPKAICAIADDAGRRSVGINFGSQDYLSLSNHSAVRDAAHEAVERYGVHSAGSPAFLGNTHYSRALEQKISEFLAMEHTVLFPTGWAAGFGAIKGLVRSSDHIVMDILAHACLQEGAAAATKNVYQHRHLDLGSVRVWLQRIRDRDRENGILVVTEGLFSMDSDTPDIAAWQSVCREYGATLMVDVAHDLGCLGDDGRGHIGMQGMLGKVDIVMGSFSKTFASNGGFVSMKSRSAQEYLRYYATPGAFSNAMSPIQAAVVLQAFTIIDSDEGKWLRHALLSNVNALREQLSGAGLEVYGAPSAIVAVKMGTEALARLTARQLPKLGLIANLVEFPAVPKGQARFRLQVMAGHTGWQIRDAVQRLTQGLGIANNELRSLQLQKDEDDEPLIYAVA